MAYQLSQDPAAKAWRARNPNYGIKSHVYKGKTGNVRYHQIELSLCQPGMYGERFRFSVPGGTPDDRIVQVRDTILAAINAGMITSHKAWNALCAEIRAALATI